MAKSKSSAKPKLNVQDLLLKKGEYLVLGVAGAGLLLLLLWGGSAYSEAKDPKKISDNLTSKAKSIDAAVGRDADPSAVPPLDGIYLPGKPGGYPTVPVKDFALAGVMFDPTARPDTKRENPRVLGLGDYQVDLVRAPMKAHDIVYDGDGGAKVAVRVVKKQSDADKEKIKDALKALREKGKIGSKAAVVGRAHPPGSPMGPGGLGGPMGPGGLGGPDGPGGPGGPGGG
ncbi:MAG TPA: hypothetical protein VH092_07590, partial [Urbifossiella sp.]|nr:hypothetical protein [Urbifossiella sp.]